MEPQNNAFNAMAPATPEQAGGSSVAEAGPGTAAAPDELIKSPEQSRVTEQLAVDHSGHAPLPTAAVAVTAQPQTAPSVPTTTATPVLTTPSTAANSSLIEKEWLEKVKQVISHTADDPHAQQKEISQVMADYVLKRTGRRIGEDGG
jgi:hypothetical protein